MRYRQLVRLALCAVTIPGAASAQRSVEFGPLVAVYSTAGSYEHVANEFRVGTPDQPSENRGIGWGGEARLWANHLLGLQLQAATSSADHPRFNTPGGGSIATTSRVTSATVQAMYGLSPVSARNRFWLSAGGGMIHHSGSAYEPYGSPTHPVGAVGLGSAIVLPYGLAASVGVTSLLYNWELSNGGAIYQRGFETDVLVHLGLTMNLH